MSSVFEKVTLYDLLGYMVPGAVFVLLGITEPLFRLGSDEQKILSDFEGYFMTAFVLISYTSGIVLSEIARWLSWLIDKVFGRDYTFINTEAVKSALEKSHLVDRQELQGALDSRKYFKFMYGIIQQEKDYGRIHGYASAEILYKNLTVAFLFNVILRMVFSKGYSVPGGTIICLAIAVIFFIRWRRFRDKKVKYTELWFRKKYT